MNKLNHFKNALLRLRLRQFSAVFVLASLAANRTLAAPVDSNHATIPFGQIGTMAQKPYTGDGLSIVQGPEGVSLRCVFQKMQGQVNRHGLRLVSTSERSNSIPFRVVARSVGRKDGGNTALENAGEIHFASHKVRFHRTGLDEEYTVNLDGVRQDFVVTSRPAGRDWLRVELRIDGATAEPANDGVRLVLSGSGRKLAYHRLKAMDAGGRELNARMEVVSSGELALVVEDADATYPVRIDPTFSDANWVNYFALPGANDEVYAAVTDSKGNIYIGGNFSIVGTASANYVAKWNGTNWSALGSGMDSSISALSLDSAGNLYAGGNFSTAGGVSANGIAKWNGVVWSPLGAGVSDGNTYSGFVSTIIFDSLGNLYAGGSFNTAGGVSATNIATWNGSTWSSLGWGLNGSVGAMTFDNLGNLYVGGVFVSAGSVNATNIARWNGSTWSSVGMGLWGGGYYGVSALALDNSGNLYAAGNFEDPVTLNNYAIAQWNGSAWSAIDPGFNQVYSLAPDKSGNLYVGGILQGLRDGTNYDYNGIAKWDGSNWFSLGSGIKNGGLGPTGGNTEVRALVWDTNGNLYVTGNFTTAGGGPAFCVARWNSANWFAIGSNNVYGLEGAVYALACDTNGNLYAGGAFRPDNGPTNILVARWNGTGWSPLASGPGAYVAALTFDTNGNLYAGGNFGVTTAGGGNANSVAKWNGTSWSALGSGRNYAVLSLGFDHAGNLYAGGTGLAKWNGSTWSSVGNPGISYLVYALAFDPQGNVYAGGQFGMAGNTAVNSIAKWNGSTWSALGSGVNYGSQISALACDANGKLYAGGDFTTTNGGTAYGIGEWNGSTWSAVGSGISSNPQFGPSISAITFDASGTLYVGGAGITIGDSGPTCVAKWDGTNWSTLGSGFGSSSANPEVTSLAMDKSGNLYVGGSFSMAGTNASFNIAKALLTGPTPNQLLLAKHGATTNLVNFLGTPGFHYALDLTTNLAAPANWTPQMTNMASTNNAAIAGYLNFTNVTGSPQGYYRTRFVP